MGGGCVLVFTYVCSFRHNILNKPVCHTCFGTEGVLDKPTLDQKALLAQDQAIQLQDIYITHEALVAAKTIMYTGNSSLFKGGCVENQQILFIMHGEPKEL